MIFSRESGEEALKILRRNLPEQYSFVTDAFALNFSANSAWFLRVLCV